MNSKQTRALVETGMLTSLVIVLGVIAAFGIPVLSLLGTMVAPVIVAMIGIRQGTKWSTMSTIVSMLGIAVLYGPLGALAEGIYLGCLGIPIGMGYRNGWKTSKLMIVPGVCLTIGMLVSMIAIPYITGIDIQVQWEHFKNQILEIIQNVYSTRGIPEGEVQTLLSQLKDQLETVKHAIITLLFISSVIIANGVASLTQLVCKKLHIPVPTLPTISEWRMPVWSVHLYLLGMILLMLSTNIFTIPILDTIAYNIMYFGAMMIVLQGLSCEWFIMSQYGIKKPFKLLGIVVGYMASMFTLILGIGDLVFNIRKYWSNR